jgi:hypothetical protein
LWKSIGDAMNISYGNLKSGEWEDGLQWLREIEDWSDIYQKSYMVSAATNKQLAGCYLEILLINVPPRFLGPWKKLMSVLLGERLRKALK